ncbi:Mlp1p NDAI_0E05040 [Naumovozyma dairenensis CBS 421]|uniref:Uncharacterized protein n=1 Tax=Naumovozyma dairenensis (strain ATCC 10597 / BCRC 20456 / CBS 421 / NBRC 0211 / NRRL Y-12639) TaxID=1071378 RepID=G0WAP8_NAUDC|nr:hypothetical protein NDAI_0E05040 [Naumovozyma dairenensis CBS 421]CCD25321.1 hypothetical protein NDAI_0E05040 [Naumovozyma dairenensis CBS 421]
MLGFQEPTTDSNKNPLSSATIAKVASFLDTSPDVVQTLDETILKSLNNRFDEFNHIENEQIKISTELEVTKKTNNTTIKKLKNELTELIDSYESVCKEKEDAYKKIAEEEEKKIDNRDELESKLIQIHSLEENVSELQSKKQELIKSLDDRITELNEYRHNIELLNNEKSKTRNKILQLENENQDLKINDLSQRTQLERLSQELETINKEKLWLEERLGEKGEQFDSYREKSINENQDLKLQLNTVKNELDQMKSTNCVLQERTDELSNKLRDTSTNLKNIQQSRNNDKATHEKELTLKQQLIVVLQSQLNELQRENGNELSLTVSDTASSSRKDSDFTREINDLKNQLNHVQERNVELEFKLRKSEDYTAVSNSTSSDDLRNSLAKAYDDIDVLKKKLNDEQSQRENFEKNLEEFMDDLETELPTLEAYRHRAAAREEELKEATLLLEKANKEKSLVSSELNQAQSRIQSIEQEIKLVAKQRSDLANQLQFFLVHNSVANDSAGPLTDEEVKFIRNIIQEDDEMHDKETDTQKVISERLTKFKDIIELQQKNMELLKTTRELATKLEEEDKIKQAEKSRIEEETIAEAKEAILTLQNYNSSLTAKIAALTKELETYKVLSNTEDSSTPADFDKQREQREIEHTQLVKELETRIASIIQESKENANILNDKIFALDEKNNHISIELAREKSAKQLAEERLKLLQKSMDMTITENERLQKRLNSLRNVVVEQDKRTHETINSLIKTRSELATVENKWNVSQNEIKLLHSSEEMLKNELTRLNEEKNSMKLLVTRLQTLQSEREHLLSTTQDKFNKELNDLEGTCNDLRKKLKEAEENYGSLMEETTELKDDFRQKKKSLKEEMSNVEKRYSEIVEKERETKWENTRLTKQLKEKTELIEKYKAASDDEGKLEEISSLQKELQVLKNELTESYSQTESYRKDIELLNQSIADINKQVLNKEAAFKERITEVELAKNNIADSNTVLKTQIDDLNNELEVQKKLYEDEKINFTRNANELERVTKGLEQSKRDYEDKLKSLMKDLEEQVKYANKAQNNYEQELQNHANVSKTISQLREQTQHYRTEIAELTISATDAKRLLNENQISWQKQRDEYEKQIEFFKKRIEEESEQNKMLFEQSKLTTQANDEDNAESSGVNSIEGDNKLVLSLRSERDLLQERLNVTEAEEKLLRERLTSIEKDFRATDLELQKIKEETHNYPDLLEQHKTVMSQLTQLDLLRESNITLRNETIELQSKNQHLQTEVENLHDKLLPLETELQTLTNLIEEKDKQLSICHEESERWKQRSQDILSKYQRIDPVEHENLAEERNRLQAQLEEKSKENEELGNRFEKLKKQAHEKLNASKISQNSLTIQINDLEAKKKELLSQLETEKEGKLSLEKRLEVTMKNSHDIVSIQSQLEEALMKSKDFETKFINSVESSKQIEENLNSEIKKLQEESSKLQEELAHEKLTTSTTEIGNVDQDTVDGGVSNDIVESMKQSFEEEKIKFIEEQTTEFKKKLQAEINKLKAEYETKQIEPVSIDENAIRKQIEEEYEQATSQRIKEAEENLKRRIRLPTEEKINKVIDKRRTQLENEFQNKVEARAKELLTGDEKNEFFDRMKKEIQEELARKYEEELQVVKKKAFDEGRQQVLMKTSFLEKKITKLESDLQNAKSNTGATDNTIVSTDNETKYEGSDKKPVTINTNVVSDVGENNAERTPMNKFPRAIMNPLLSNGEHLNLILNPSSSSLQPSPSNRNVGGTTTTTTTTNNNNNNNNNNKNKNNSGSGGNNNPFTSPFQLSTTTATIPQSVVQPTFSFGSNVNTSGNSNADDNSNSNNAGEDLVYDSMRTSTSLASSESSARSSPESKNEDNNDENLGKKEQKEEEEREGNDEDNNNNNNNVSENSSQTKGLSFSLGNTPIATEEGKGTEASLSLNLPMKRAVDEEAEEEKDREVRKGEDEDKEGKGDESDSNKRSKLE